MNRKLIFGIILVFTLSLIAANNFGFQNIHHQSGQATVNYDSLFENATPLEKSMEGHELLQLCIKQYGGKEKLNQLVSLELKYRMISSFSSDSTNITKLWHQGRKYKILRKSDNSTECRIINENQAWFQNLDTAIGLDRGRYKAELFSYLTLAMPAAAFSERFDEIRYGVREGDHLAYIYFKKNDSLLMAIGIDPHEMVIKSSEGMIFQGDERFRFKNQFDDFKIVDGFLIPHSLVNISMGLEVGRSSLIDVKINREIPESEFKPGKLVNLKRAH